VYVQWGRKSCTNDHETVYYGVVMASHYSQRKSMFLCVDWERQEHRASNSGSQNGGLLYTSEVEQGSAGDEYGHDIEVSCAVCAPKMKNTAVYTRWGERKCPIGSGIVYDGWIGGGAHNHNGSGANLMCMHPQPQRPDGASTGNQNGALIYGAEYENTGAVDKNHDRDAACIVCEKVNVGSVYVQWGRRTCTNGHNTEYWGVIMAQHYSQQKGEFVCVDWERAIHKTSHN
jgi:hypothetical protein